MRKESNGEVSCTYVRLPVLLVKERGTYVAQCLDVGACGQGKSEASAMRDLEGCLQVQYEEALKTNTLDSFFTPAPAEYWQMYHNLRITREKNQLLLRQPSRLTDLFPLEITYV